MGKIHWSNKNLPPKLENILNKKIILFSESLNEAFIKKRLFKSKPIEEEEEEE